MKATELMIGDWCQSEDLTMPAKYTGYFKKYSPLKGEPYIRLEFLYDGGHEGADIPESRIEPIPLTAEILEKNGWYVPLLKSWWEHPDIAFWMKAYTDGTFELMIDEDSDISFCTIRFVHELQHALRLCGLKELADNFKV